MLMRGLTKHLTLLSPCSFSATGLADRALTLICTLGRAAGLRASPVWQSLTTVSSQPSNRGSALLQIPPQPLLHCASLGC